MSQSDEQQQDHNTSQLVMSTFYKVASRDGVTAEDITRYLQDKFGDVWRANTLTGKAEKTLQKSVGMGFLEKCGDRYVAKLVREMGCFRRKRKRCSHRRRRRRRRRQSCRRRRRRRRSCCCR